MNCSISLFGDFGHGYSQYPFDGTESVFKKLASKATAKTQLAVHREGELMYYCYLRKLDSSDSHYFGICVLLNGVMLPTVKDLFTLFEKIFTTLVVSGDILKFSGDGNIVSNVDSLRAKKNEVENIENTIRNAFGIFDNKTKSLPPVSFGISSEEIKVLAIDDDPSVIQNAITTYSYCLVLKSTDYDNESMTSYRGTLKSIHDENLKLKEKNEKLEAEVKKVQRQKKQYRYVVIGFICLFLACLKLFDLNKNLDSAIQQNADLNQENEGLNNNVSALEEKIKEKDQALFEKNKSLLMKGRMLSAMKTQFNYNRQYVPTSLELVIVNQDNDSIGTMSDVLSMNSDLRLKPQLSYLSERSEVDSIMVRWYTPSTIEDSVYYYSKYAVNISLGHHVLRFPLWQGPNGTGWEYGHYRAEIWSIGEDATFLKKKDFWIN